MANVLHKNWLLLTTI